MINSISDDKVTLKTADVSLIKTVPKHNFTDNITGLLNLPVELHQKIAWNLNAIDYASLRGTCSVLHEDLHSFSVLNDIVKNASCNGELKKQSESILKSHAINDIRHQDHLLAAIKTLQSVYISNEENIIAFDIELPFNTDAKKRNDLFMMIESIHQHINYCFFKYFRHVNNEKNIYVLSFVLDMHLGRIQHEDPFPAKLFLKTLQDIFDKKDNDNKFFIAFFVMELMQLWNIHPPRGTDKKMINALNIAHQDLISTGKIVKRIAMEEIMKKH